MAWNSSFGVSQLRPRAIWDSASTDWSAPPVDYSAGEMPGAPVSAPSPPMQMEEGPWMGGSQPTPQTDPRDTGAEPWYGGPQAPTMGAPPSQVTPPRVNTYDPEGSSRSTMDLVNRMFTPEFTDRDRLRALMDAAPERQAPGWGRGLSAIAMGIGTKDPTQALANQESIMFAPHRRAMADWTAKADPFLKTAELENRQNINERTLTSNVVTSETAARRAESQQRMAADKIASTEKIAADKNEVARIRAQNDTVRARAYAAKNEGATIKETPDRFIGIFPDGRRIDLGPSTDMDGQTKADILGEWKVEANKALGGQFFRDPTTGVVTRGNARDPDSPVPPPGSVPMTGSGSRTAKDESPGDMEKRQTLEWRRLRDTDADVKRWTTIKPNGKIELKDEPTMGSWLQSDESDQKDIDSFTRAKNLLYPSQKGIGPSEDVAPGNTRAQQENAGRNTGIGPTKEAAARLAAPPPPKEAAPEKKLPIWNPPLPNAGTSIGAPTKPAGKGTWVTQRGENPTLLEPSRMVNGVRQPAKYSEGTETRKVWVPEGYRLPEPGEKPVAHTERQIDSQIELSKQAEQVASGGRVKIMDKTGKVVATIPNDPKSISEAESSGFTVKR